MHNILIIRNSHLSLAVAQLTGNTAIVRCWVKAYSSTDTLDTTLSCAKLPHSLWLWSSSTHAGNNLIPGAFETNLHHKYTKHLVQAHKKPLKLSSCKHLLAVPVAAACKSVSQDKSVFAMSPVCGEPQCLHPLPDPGLCTFHVRKLILKMR